MERQKILQQMIDLNKIFFDSWFSMMAMFQHQTEEILKPFVDCKPGMDGRMKKFIAESTLMGQAFVMNPDITVAQAAKDAGVEVTGFVRMGVGEGIEKEKEDFAAEVAKTLKG